MMRGRHTAVVLVCALATSALATSAHAATVRGRLLQSVSGKSVPAGGIAVTMMDGHGKRSFAITSDADGMYYFQNVTAGSYTLQVWKPASGPPLPFPVTVQEPLTDVNPLNLP